jgi:hypothetical protein
MVQPAPFVGDEHRGDKEGTVVEQGGKLAESPMVLRIYHCMVSSAKSVVLRV